MVTRCLLFKDLYMNSDSSNLSQKEIVQNRLKGFGDIPIFMPDATRGAVRGLTTSQLVKTGINAIVTNTLHLTIAPTSERIQELGGIHSYMNWDGPILTDSGGFQVFSLIHTGKWKGKVHDNGADFISPRDGTKYELTPELSIDIQMRIGSDILVVLDDCRKAQVDREQAEISVKRTLEWAERCKRHFEDVYGGTEKTGKLLTAVVQGANFIDLRKSCAKELSDMDFDGYNFGGYVLDDDGNLVVKEMEAVVENTPSDKFNYAMGVGKPEDIVAATKLGYNVFDTVLVTRNARHGTLYIKGSDGNGFPGEVVRIGNSKYATDLGPIDETCDCEACVNHSRAYIHHLLKVGEMTGYTLVTIHNVRFYQRLMESLV
jgi:queuine tRNA-ribosyltransferase